MINSKFSFRQWAMIIGPVILIIFMWTVFINLTGYFGLQKGYLYSFIIYWVLWCLVFPVIMLKGFKNVFALFKSVKPRFGEKADLTLFLLTWPIVICLIFAFIPQYHHLTVPTILLSIILGLVNGFSEEILWRGVYVNLFPGNTFLSHIYPSIFFALWHICPISVVATRYSGGIYSFLGVSFLLGLSWGYYARKTGSIRWSVITHAVFDILGLGGLFYAIWFV